MAKKSSSAPGQPGVVSNPTENQASGAPKDIQNGGGPAQKTPNGVPTPGDPVQDTSNVIHSIAVAHNTGQPLPGTQSLVNTPGLASQSHQGLPVATPGSPPPGSGSDDGSLANAGVQADAANAAALAKQTQANRPTQVNPFSFQNWTQDANGNWTQTTGLQGGLGRGATNLENQIGAQGQIGTGDQARNQAITGAYNQATSRLNPQWAQNDEQLGAQLQAQGLDPNSEAYRTAMRQEGQAKNDAYSSAMNGAISQGTAAQQATFNENLAAQNNPYQQLGWLQGMTQQPGFNAAGAAPQSSTLQAQLAQSGLNIQQQQIAAQYVTAGMNVAAAIAKAAGDGSDERVKENVQRLPVDAIPGVPFSLFQYKGDPAGRQYGGVIAQDLEKVAPQHVREDGLGIKHVSPPFTPFSFK